MTHFNNAAQRNGYEAAGAGQSINSNPFSIETDAGQAWECGWLLGEAA